MLFEGVIVHLKSGTVRDLGRNGRFCLQFQNRIRLDSILSILEDSVFIQTMSFRG